MTPERGCAECLENANELPHSNWFAVVYLKFPTDASKLLRDGIYMDFFVHTPDLVSNLLGKKWLSSITEAYVPEVQGYGTIST